MKELTRLNASLEALSKKSFKKYLKTLIKDKLKYLDNAQFKPHSYPYGARIEAEYNILCQVYDDYLYHQERKKDKRNSKCKI